MSHDLISPRGVGWARPAQPKWPLRRSMLGHAGVELGTVFVRARDGPVGWLASVLAWPSRRRPGTMGRQSVSGNCRAGFCVLN